MVYQMHNHAASDAAFAAYGNMVLMSKKYPYSFRLVAMGCVMTLKRIGKALVYQLIGIPHAYQPNKKKSPLAFLASALNVF